MFIRGNLVSVDQIRFQFPALQQNIHGKDLVYFDWAATSHMPDFVLQKMTESLTIEHGNVRRGVHTFGAYATQNYEKARRTIARFINGCVDGVIMTSGTTHGLNILAQCAGETLCEGDVVVLTEVEHHSHQLPWRMMAQQKGFLIQYVPMDENGRICMSRLQNILKTSRVRMIGLPYISNVLGTIQPIHDVVTLAQLYGIKVVVDAAQAVAHMPIDVQKLGIDAIAFGSDKMYGPAGIGALWVEENWLKTFKPTMFGGGMIEEAGFEEIIFAQAPFAFEAGTPNVAGAVGMASAIDWLQNIGWEEIEKQERALRFFLQNALSEIPQITLLCEKPDIPLFSFVLKDVHAHDIATLCDLEGIMIRAGHHCVSPYHHKMGLTASSRISLSFLNHISECVYFVQTLGQIVKYMGEL